MNGCWPTRAADAHSALVYVNQVGGQDELVFDGCSLAFDPEGQLLARGPQFASELLIVDVPVPAVYRQRLLDPRGRISKRSLPLVDVSAAPVAAGEPATNPLVEPLAPEVELYEALVLGTRDYCRKNGFTDVVIGLSGGIDSSLVAVIAAEALGAEHVHGVSMPSRYSSDHSKTDARALADNLGIEYRTIPIEPAFTAFLDMLDPSFEGRPPGLTQENLQSRCRGQVLMALSNEFGWMVLTTGNKSEMAVGYFTIYGDSVGGYGVIKDVLKTARLRAEPLRQRAGRPGGHPRGRAHQAAVGRAATGPARRPEPAALRRARPDPRGLRRGGSDSRARSSSSGTTKRSSGASPGSSTSPSTSGGRAHPACVSRPRRSASDRRMPITNGYR